MHADSASSCASGFCQELFGDLEMISIDAKCAFVSDELCERKQPKKIGRADLLIAAIVLANDATRTTHKLRHVIQVASL